MAAHRSQNRQMFWRIVRRLLGANRGRLLVILLALGAGAAVTAALLNLQVDAKRRLTTEFRAFGPNVLVLPKTPSGSGTLPESIVHSVPVDLPSGRVVVKSASLLRGRGFRHATGKISLRGCRREPIHWHFSKHTRALLRRLQAIRWLFRPPTTGRECVVGTNVARQLDTQQDAQLTLTIGDRQETCQIASFRQDGGPEDDRVELGLRTAQRLADLPGRISAVELIVPGTPREIQTYITGLQRDLPDAEVRPVRQFTESQAKIYGRISASLLKFTVGIVLLLTGLCVMAAMTNVAMERRNDVGLMKAIGGATRRVLRLFLAEAALLGFAGGAIGAAVGIFLSIWLGKEVFGVAAQPRLIVYPVAVVLTMIVAILSAYPLRRLASIRPASVFRGEA